MAGYPWDEPKSYMPVVQPGETPPMPVVQPPEGDPKLGELDEAMREKVARIIAQLREQGYQPKISNAMRTPEQQAEKVRLGYAPASTLGKPGGHLSGQAADIIDRRWGWDETEKNAKFFAALTDAARKEGLIAGGTWFGHGGTRLKPTSKSEWHKWGVGHDPAHVELRTGGRTMAYPWDEPSTPDPMAGRAEPEVPPIDPRLAYLFRQPQSMAPGQDLIDRYRQALAARGISASQGPNVAAQRPAGAPQREPNEAEQALANIIAARVRASGAGSSGAGVPAGMPPTMQLGQQSTSSTTQPGAYSPGIANILAKTFLADAEAAKEALGTAPYEQLKYGFRPKEGGGTIAMRPSVMDVEASLTDDERRKMMEIEGSAAKEKEKAEQETQGLLTDTPEQTAKRDAERRQRLADIAAAKETAQDAVRSEVRQRLIATEKETVPGTGQLGQYAKDISRISEMWRRKNLEREQAGFAEDKRSRELQLAEKNLADLDQRIAKAQIDPNRYWTGGIPGAGGVVFGAFKAIGHAVANAFGAYAQGMSRGAIPNTALQIMEKAMDRDIAIQKHNLNKLMETRGFGKETRNFMSGEFDKAMSRRKSLELDMQQLVFAKSALESGSEKVREEAAKNINLLARSAALALSQAEPKTTTTTAQGQREVVNPLAEAVLKQKTEKAGKPLPAEVGTKIRGALQLVRDTNALRDEFKRINPSRFEVWRTKDKDGAAFQNRLDKAIFNWVKAQSGASFTIPEYEKRKSLFDSRWITGWAPAMSSLRDLRQEAVMEALRIMSQYPDAINSAVGDDLREILRDPYGSGKQQSGPNYPGKPAQ